MEQVQAQSQQMLLNAMSEMQTQNRRQFQVLNNNISGALVVALKVLL
jgi:hypothetical protein